MKPLPPAAILAARSQAPARVAQAQQWAAQVNLDKGSELRLHASHTDAYGQTHVRFRQYVNGVPVRGAEAIAHFTMEGTALAPSLYLASGIQPVSPDLDAAQAIHLAETALRPKGAFERPSRAELLYVKETSLRTLGLARNTGATKMDEAAGSIAPLENASHRLVYRVETDLANALDGLRYSEVFVDALSGAVLRVRDRLETLAPDGQGKGFYNSASGGVYAAGPGAPVPLTTTVTPTGFEMRDTVRGTRPHPFSGEVGNLTYDMAYGTGGWTGLGSVYANATNLWGDGLKRDRFASTSGPNGETTAVDAHFGLQATWDFYQNVLGRNGIDDQGTSTFNRVHFLAPDFFNAFWDPNIFGMTYGDGDGVNGLAVTSLDVVGHELSHGVCHASADLAYYGEAGGLNEANSDILGTMVEFYTRGAATGVTVPEEGGNFLIAEQVWNPALRYMFKPSLDGMSYDYWFDGISGEDPHFASGPMNRAFYFMAKGIGKTFDTTPPFFSPETIYPGIGNDAATRIWYRALTVYLTPFATYADAREACLRAARDLYGGKSSDLPFEGQMVSAAFAGIGVGDVLGADGASVFQVPEVRFGDLPPEAQVSETEGVFRAGASAALTAQVFRQAAPNGTPVDHPVVWAAISPLTGAPLNGFIGADGTFAPPHGFNGPVFIYASESVYGTAFARRLAYVAETDVNGDGATDWQDMGQLALAWSRQSGEGGYNPKADLSGNRRVNDFDLSLFLFLFR